MEEKIRVGKKEKEKDRKRDKRIKHKNERNENAKQRREKECSFSSLRGKTNGQFEGKRSEKEE